MKSRGGPLDGKCLQVLAGSDKVAEIHERNREIVVLLGCVEGVLDAIQLLVADADMHFGAIRQLADAGFNDLLKQRLGFVELLCLQ